MSTLQSLLTALLFIGLAAITACGPAESERPTADVSPATTDQQAETIYASAVNNPARSDKDRQRDPLRKPDQVLQFFGVKRGANALDLFSGGGYYTELLSYVVGDTGHVVAHTNAAYANFVGDEAITRYAERRLPNVELLAAENNELLLPANRFDVVMLVLAYHDIYYVAPDDGWPKIDGPALPAELYKGMKPGAVLGIVDHAAARGAPQETGNTLHRIDPQLARSEIEKAGFVFEEAADMLRNANDDHSLNMADPAIRGRTDRFVMRFRKPG
jgi:predicted methyltransferase